VAGHGENLTEVRRGVRIDKRKSCQTRTESCVLKKVISIERENGEKPVQLSQVLQTVHPVQEAPVAMLLNLSSSPSGSQWDPSRQSYGPPAAVPQRAAGQEPRTRIDPTRVDDWCIGLYCRNVLSSPSLIGVRIDDGGEKATTMSYGANDNVDMTCAGLLPFFIQDDAVLGAKQGERSPLGHASMT